VIAPPTDDIAAGIAQLDELQAAHAIARQLCTRCGKRFGEVAAPDGAYLCPPCVVPHARWIRRNYKLERERQRRMFPPKMTVPKGKR